VSEWDQGNAGLSPPSAHLVLWAIHIAQPTSQVVGEMETGSSLYAAIKFLKEKQDINLTNKQT